MTTPQVDKSSLFKKMFGRPRDAPLPPRAPNEPAGTCMSDEPTIQVPPRRNAPVTPPSVTPGRSLTASVLGRGPTGSVHSVFELGKKLGAGQFGTVYLCQEIATKQYYACKSISRSSLISEEDVADVRTEVSVMYRLQEQPHIVRLKGTFEDRHHVHIVMELCKGGELFDEINRRVANDHVPYREKDASMLAKALVTAVARCHALGVIHRDLKPENFLLTTRHSDATLKAADFGLAAVFKPGQKFSRVCGSAMYMAPEVVRLYNGKKSKYGPPVDIWAAGVMIYIILAGAHPFSPSRDRSEGGFMKCILRGALSFSSPDWKNVSEDAKNLIRSMLQPNAEDRPTAEQVLAHPWIQNAPNAPLGREVMKRFQHFIELVQLKKFKKAALKILSESLTEQMLVHIRSAVQQRDATSAGTVPLSALFIAVGEIGSPETAQRLEAAALEAGMEGDVCMEYADFLVAVAQLCQVERQENLFRAFSLFDEDLTGFITQTEMVQACTEINIPDSVREELVAEVNRDEAGRIDYNEFVTMMRKGAGGLQSTNHRGCDGDRVYKGAYDFGGCRQPRDSRGGRSVKGRGNSGPCLEAYLMRYAVNTRAVVEAGFVWKIESKWCHH